MLFVSSDRGSCYLWLPQYVRSFLRSSHNPRQRATIFALTLVIEHLLTLYLQFTFNTGRINWCQGGLGYSSAALVQSSSMQNLHCCKSLLIGEMRFDMCVQISVSYYSGHIAIAFLGCTAIAAHYAKPPQWLMATFVLPFTNSLQFSTYWLHRWIQSLHCAYNTVHMILCMCI